MRLVIGKRAAAEALKGRYKVYRVFLTEVALGKLEGTEFLTDIHKANIPLEVVDRRELDDISGSTIHQGIAVEAADLVFSDLKSFIHQAEGDAEATVVIMNNIEDPQNLGAILRSAEVFGIRHIILPKLRTAPFNEIAYKSASGAVEYLDLIRVTNIADAIKELKKAGFWVIGTAEKGKDQITGTMIEGKIAVVIGSEGKGISRRVEEECDFLVRIPTYGNISSLNASCAAGIIFYEIGRGKAMRPFMRRAKSLGKADREARKSSAG